MLRPVFPDVKNFNCSDLYLQSTGAPAGGKIWRACHEIAHMLIEKNISYGNSALEPLGVFSQLSAKEGLLIRIDDKLKRIKNGSLEKDDEDVINDLIGYLVLLKISDSK